MSRPVAVFRIRMDSPGVVDTLSAVFALLVSRGFSGHEYNQGTQIVTPGEWDGNPGRYYEIGFGPGPKAQGEG